MWVMLSSGHISGQSRMTESLGRESFFLTMKRATPRPNPRHGVIFEVPVIVF
jgi:hypothetical protein